MLRLIRLNRLALSRFGSKTTLQSVTTAPVAIFQQPINEIRVWRSTSRSCHWTSTLQRGTINDAIHFQSLSKTILPCVSTVPSKEIAAFTAFGTMAKTNHKNENEDTNNPFLAILTVAGALLACISSSGTDTKFVHAAKRKRETGSSVTPT